jgi:hypothetical protein
MAAQNTMPERLGPYRLLERIGEGGMGVVHLAHDEEGRAVAVKVLRPGVAIDPDARRRLGREFETMRRVRSPFVAEVIDADVTGDMPYVVTRYVAGRSLDQMIRDDGPMYGRALERLAWGLSEGLAAVHAAGVVHRDLKPANVVMAGGVPVLIDFGIAHAPDATRITQAGMFMGTPGYLAPEVVEGQPSGPAADVHSWGSTVAFAATGRPPYGTGSYETIFYRIVGGKADLDGIPAKLMPLVTAALGRDPARRPSAMQLTVDCAAIDLSGPDTAANGRVAPTRSANGAIGASAAAALAGSARAATPAAPGTIMEGSAALIAAPDAGRPHWTREFPAMRRNDDFADLLPPVSYRAAPAVPAVAPQGNGTDPAAKAPAKQSSGATSHAGFRRLLSLVTMGIAVAASVLLPVAGTIASLAAIVLLRAADRTHSGLATRRSERGARLSDVPVMIVKTPWAVVRALFSCLVLAPLALTCGAAAAVATVFAVHSNPLQAAGAYAAGGFVACYGFGPGSGTPRRQLGRLFGVLARRQMPAALTAVVVAVIAVGTVGAAITQPHHLWPLTTSLASHLQGLHNLADRLQIRLQRL